MEGATLSPHDSLALLPRLTPAAASKRAGHATTPPRWSCRPCANMGARRAGKQGTCTSGHMPHRQTTYSHCPSAHGHTWCVTFPHMVTHGHTWSHMVRHIPTHGHTWSHMVRHIPTRTQASTCTVRNWARMPAPTILRLQRPAEARCRPTVPAPCLPQNPDSFQQSAVRLHMHVAAAWSWKDAPYRAVHQGSCSLLAMWEDNCSGRQDPGGGQAGAPPHDPMSPLLNFTLTFKGGGGGSTWSYLFASRSLCKGCNPRCHQSSCRWGSSHRRRCCPV
jgi:hypothetical protein